MPDAPPMLGRILVVDDTDLNRDMLSRRLIRHGYSVSHVDGGEAALKLLDREEFDLILLDVMMPDVSGLDVLQSVRKQHSATELPVIMQTAKVQSEDLVEAFKLGASDYVTKPLDFPVVLSRVKTQLTLKHSVDEIRRLKADIQQTHAELTETHELVKRELQSAAKIQGSLLPTNLPAIPGVRFSWSFQPCDELAGDALNIVPLDDDHVGFYVLDVAGHGVSSALLSFTVSHMLNGNCSRTSILKQPVSDTKEVRLTPPAEVAQLLTEQFSFDANFEKFFTMFYGQLNVKTRELRYVSAGHPPPILWRPGKLPSQLGSTGLPIGITGIDYEESRITLEPRDRLFLFSDGINEAMSPQREIFGTQRLLHAIARGSDSSLAECVTGITTDLSSWSGQSGVKDDESLLAIEIDR